MGNVTDTNKKGRSRKRKRRNLFLTLLPYIIIVLAVLAFRFIFLINARIPTESMVPEIVKDTRAIGLKCAYWFSEPQRGDVVVFDAPDDPDTLYVKRVIGLPGETVEISDGVTYIDGEPLEEEYLAETMTGSFGPFEVPEGCYFMMGDNRNHSYDSRYWTNTYVTMDHIHGKLVFTYYPSLKLVD